MKIGIDIGGSHLGVGLINNSGKIIQKIEKDILIGVNKNNYEKFLLDNLIELIEELLDKSKVEISKINLIGIAVPGTVSNTHIIKAGNLHIKDFNITSEINKYFNVPIKLRNDAKCAALAEKEYGSLKKSEDALFLTLGTGVGGAVFLNGILLKPKMYEGFEIGHIVIKKDGIKCNCRRKRCIEKYASMKALKDTIQREYSKYDLAGKEIKELIDEEIETEKMQKIIDEYVSNLSLGIANLINIFEPERISIGGSFVYYKDILLPKLEEAIKGKKATFNGRQDIKIVLAKLKNDAGIIGATL